MITHRTRECWWGELLQYVPFEGMTLKDVSALHLCAQPCELRQRGPCFYTLRYTKHTLWSLYCKFCLAVAILLNRS